MSFLVRPPKVDNPQHASKHEDFEMLIQTRTLDTKRNQHFQLWSHNGALKL